MDYRPAWARRAGSAAAVGEGLARQVGEFPQESLCLVEPAEQQERSAWQELAWQEPESPGPARRL